jgi:hypothetical protein
MVAAENLEEWTSSVWVQIETVRATIEAAAGGLIRLAPAEDPGGNGAMIPGRESSRPRRLEGARFLGWTREHNRPVVAGPAS